MTGNKVPHRVYFGFMDSYIYTHFTKLQASINCHAPIHDYKGQSKQLKLIATVNCTDRLLSPTHILTVPRNTPNANEDRPCTHPPQHSTRMVEVKDDVSIVEVSHVEDVCWDVWGMCAGPVLVCIWCISRYS